MLCGIRSAESEEEVEVPCRPDAENRWYIPAERLRSVATAAANDHLRYLQKAITCIGNEVGQS